VSVDLRSLRAMNAFAEMGVGRWLAMQFHQERHCRLYPAPSITYVCMTVLHAWSHYSPLISIYAERLRQVTTERQWLGYIETLFILLQHDTIYARNASPLLLVPFPAICTPLLRGIVLQLGTSSGGIDSVSKTGVLGCFTSRSMAKPR
jgi:hypothetical protein